MLRAIMTEKLAECKGDVTALNYLLIRENKDLKERLEKMQASLLACHKTIHEYRKAEGRRAGGANGNW